MVHANEALLRQAYEAQARGDLEGCLELLSGDFVLHIPGVSRIAGEYRGREEANGASMRTRGSGGSGRIPAPASPPPDPGSPPVDRSAGRSDILGR